MRKVLFTVYFTGLILIAITACTDGDADDLDFMENADETDVETLLAANEKLLEQLEKEKVEADLLKERIQELEEENAVFKDDLLTYKQQMIELEDGYEQELSLRNQLDDMAKNIFMAMDEKNHEFLQNSVADNVIVVPSSEVLETYAPDDQLDTFHYLQLNDVKYIRQVDFFYDKGENRFVTEYFIYSVGDKNPGYNGEVELIFTYEDSWKLSSIKYKY
ncbi:hypothetical protein SAMN05421736_105141 [Evansella caseinilytica]|uniref:Uncharacterized protein n=1 Tax=Evansella caseinilytica TaxID=1503961 RepID=A0A1H3PPF9_9BACI|nr:hypothetical protein [Evansella caseinilytica]SDZ02916.1 hypothetical protein SAMN05421736_105141 [Evansella caseinilytica]